MKAPLFINSRIKLAWWIAYTAAILAILLLAAFYLSTMVWVAAPFLFLLGYGLQSYVMHKNIMRPQIPRESTEFAISPKTVNQDMYNLCGPAALLYALLYARPNDAQRFVTSFQDNPENVKLSLPTRIKKDLNSFPVDLAIMMALKHHFNLTGYHPIGQGIEMVQGATFSKQMVDWMQFFEDYLKIDQDQRGYTETTELRNTYGHPLSRTHQAMLGGTYSKKHMPIKDFDAHFEYLHTRFQMHNSIIMLIDINLCLKILGQKSDDVMLSLAGVEFSHYVYVHEIEQLKNNRDDDNQLSCFKIKISTWGVCAEAVISYEDFQKGFRGFLGWESLKRPTTKIAVSTQNECEAAAQNIRDNFIPQYTKSQQPHFSLNRDSAGPSEGSSLTSGLNLNTEERALVSSC